MAAACPEVPSTAQTSLPELFDFEDFLTPLNAFNVVQRTSRIARIAPKDQWAYQVTGMLAMITSVLLNLEKLDSFNKSNVNIKPRLPDREMFDRHITRVKERLLHPDDRQLHQAEETGNSRLSVKLRNAFAHSSWKFELQPDGNNGVVGYEYILVRDKDGFHARIHVVALCEHLKQIMDEYCYVLSRDAYADIVRRHAHLQRSYTVGDDHCFLSQARLDELRNACEQDLPVRLAKMLRFRVM